MSNKTVREAQQELAQNCGYEDQIIWDLLSSNDHQFMKDKIRQLIPDQNKGQNEIIKLRNTIFERMWEQKHFNTGDCCMIYIDETGRVYENWSSYLNENVLPPGAMVAPRKGVYNFDTNNKVILDVYCTPNATSGAKAMNAAQTGSAVLGTGAALVPFVGLVMPVAAPIMMAAGAIGLGVGLFTTVTSALNLQDRKKHSQSISITDREARGNYIGVVGGAVGVAAAGATRLMTSMAAAGKATAGIEILVNGMNISSIMISGSGVASGVLDMIFKYNDGDEISSLDILQLSASLVLFTHSVNNFQLASQIANNARVNSIKSYREMLSNRQRKMFDKISKETIRIRGYIQGKMDIIRGVNEIPSRKYLNDLFKINKQLNQHSVRPAFGVSGKNIILNNKLPVKTETLRQSVQHKIGPNLLEKVTCPIPPTHNSDNYTTSTTKAANLLYSNKIVQHNIDNNFAPFKDKSDNPYSIFDMTKFVICLSTGYCIDLKQFGAKFLKNISDGNSFQDIVLSMAENLQRDTFKYLMKLAQAFIDDYLEDIHQVLKMFIPTESILYRILKEILDNYRDLSFGFINSKGPHILAAVKTYYLKFNSKNSYGISRKCSDCGGMICISRL